MQMPYRVLWHEGMLLSPQHFQIADRHVEAMFGQMVRALIPDHFGVLAVEFDTLMLAEGNLALARLECILPDGTPVAIADPNHLPVPVRLNEAFATPATERVAAWLTLPVAVPGALAVSDDGVANGRPTRYRKVACAAHDESGAGRERQVAQARPNLRLALGEAPPEGYTALRLAEIVRDGTGAFVIASDHAPPCLHIAASKPLRDVIARMAEILVQRSSDLGQLRRSRIKGMIEFTASELGNQLMLQAINSHLPEVLSLLGSAAAHPRDAFRPLAALAGELTSFSDEGHPRELPAYDHEHPLVCFRALESRLRGLLQTVVSTKYTPVRLVLGSNRTHAGSIPEHVLEGARFYLSVACAIAAERVIREIPANAKIASGGRIQQLIMQAMPGIGLDYLPTPPADIPVQPGAMYFQLRTSGDHWEQARKTRTIAVYLPPDFNDARVEILAVKD